MNATEQWPHKWFGVWKEYGPSYIACPAAQEFVRPDITARYDKARMRQYLTSASVIASSSRRNFPNPFTGERTSGTISFRTDGRWLWLDDLADYIDQYDIALPDEFSNDIRRNQYVPPEVGPEAMRQLEWPPIERTSG